MKLTPDNPVHLNIHERNKELTHDNACTSKPRIGAGVFGKMFINTF